MICPFDSAVAHRTHEAAPECEISRMITAITNVQVFDGADVIEARTVVVNGARIDAAADRCRSVPPSWRAQAGHCCPV